MSKVKSFAIGLAAVAVTASVPATSFAAFGPANRATFTCSTPTTCVGADYVAFNSFTNAPNYGDERAFFDGKDATDVNGKFTDVMNVKNGQEVQLRVYVHNNADPKRTAAGQAIAKTCKGQIINNSCVTHITLITIINQYNLTINCSEVYFQNGTVQYWLDDGSVVDKEYCTTKVVNPPTPQCPPTAPGNYPNCVPPTTPVKDGTPGAGNGSSGTPSTGQPGAGDSGTAPSGPCHARDGNDELVPGRYNAAGQCVPA